MRCSYKDKKSHPQRESLVVLAFTSIHSLIRLLSRAELFHRVTSPRCLSNQLSKISLLFSKWKRLIYSSCLTSQDKSSFAELLFPSLNNTTRLLPQLPATSTEASYITHLIESSITSTTVFVPRAESRKIKVSGWVVVVSVEVDLLACLKFRERKIARVVIPSLFVRSNLCLLVPYGGAVSSWFIDEEKSRVPKNLREPLGPFFTEIEQGKVKK